MWCLQTQTPNWTKSLTTKQKNKLKQDDFHAQLPLELKSNRSGLAFRVDNHIFKNSEEEIKQELCNENEWIGSITQLYKFPKDNTFKITFYETAKALKAQEVGLLLFSMRIPKHQIKQDKFHDILTCYICYAIDDHTINNCHKER